MYDIQKEWNEDFSIVFKIKIFNVSTNTTFLEDDYIKNHKPKSKVILEELSGEIVNPYTSPIISEQVEGHEYNDEEIPPVQKQLEEPRCHGRVTRFFAR